MTGKTISHYKILEKLGGGGMGVVYKAEDTKLKRPVALKFLPPELTRDDEAKERFVHEAQAASALDHPNICTIYEIDETDDGQIFICMAYYEGETLKKKIERGPLPIDQTLDLAMQIAQGLARAHEAGITHRDIKPANIMITNRDEIKIVDFGLAKLAGRTKLTKEGLTLGTIAYMSPEQAQGVEVDHRTDIWALGVVLYEMLTGQLPFRSEYELAMVYSILNEEPEPVTNLRKEVPSELEKIVQRALQKESKSRYASVAELEEGLREIQTFLSPTGVMRVSAKPILQSLKKPQIAISFILAILVLCFLAIWFFNRSAKIRWAREQAIPEIVQLIDKPAYMAAFRIAHEAEKYLPADPLLKQLWPRMSQHISIQTTPPGANIFITPYNVTDSDWELLGKSPIDSIRIPLGFFRWKIEKLGYQTKEIADSGAFSRFANESISITLDEEGSIPPEMVRVQGSDVRLNTRLLRHLEAVRLETYFIDKYEVTNKQYKAFLDSGGYRKQEYWKHKFVKDGRVLSWEEAMAEFVDATGRPGPATWELGFYPAGQDDYPVTGVSWYEAAAYLEFVGKSLPTVYHWDHAASIDATEYIVPASNFSGRGPAAVGSYRGLGYYGTYDMAGSIKEWCWNESGDKRYIMGGAWNESEYMFNEADIRSPFDRSPTYGIRGVKYLSESDFPTVTRGPIPFPLQHSLKIEPVPDDIYRIYERLYSYDKTDLKAKIESVDESAEHWRQEKISFQAAYGNERVIAYLFLPRNVNPPYQTVIYFPFSSAITRRSSENLYPIDTDFIVISGRAVLFPIYKGTHERGDALDSPFPNLTSFYRDHVIMWAKDLGRSIDFMETRKDIDTARLALLGNSWGGAVGPIMSAIEKRIKVTVLLNGGLFTQSALPEADQTTFVSRVTHPVLMLNGRYDHVFSVETSQIPMFRYLGTSEKNKRRIMYDTGHELPRNEKIKEVLDWLDRYLGPIK
ncbi:protein kinase [candidate division KSB1 bacterium]|nr:protein kinase [candidate division KSB1 bacterium]